MTLGFMVAGVGDERHMHADAVEWQATRGARSGRVAWQYFIDLPGRRGVVIG